MFHFQHRKLNNRNTERDNILKKQLETITSDKVFQSDLHLYSFKNIVTSLGNIEEVTGYLSATNCYKLKEISNLKMVKGYMSVDGTQIKSLPENFFTNSYMILGKNYLEIPESCTIKKGIYGRTDYGHETFLKYKIEFPHNGFKKIKDYNNFRKDYLEINEYCKINYKNWVKKLKEGYV